MNKCIRSESIKSNETSCEYAKPDMGSWDLKCEHPCVLALKKKIVELERTINDKDRLLLVSQNNNKMLVRAFDGFLPMCRKVVEASETINKEGEVK